MEALQFGQNFTTGLKKKHKTGNLTYKNNDSYFVNGIIQEPITVCDRYYQYQSLHFNKKTNNCIKKFVKNLYIYIYI